MMVSFSEYLTNPPKNTGRSFTLNKIEADGAGGSLEQIWQRFEILKNNDLKYKNQWWSISVNTSNKSHWKVLFLE